jgi:hypothetical protein
MNNKINLTRLHDKLYYDLFHKDIFPQDLVFYIEVIPNSSLRELVELELQINEIYNEQ